MNNSNFKSRVSTLSFGSNSSSAISGLVQSYVFTHPNNNILIGKTGSTGPTGSSGGGGGGGGNLVKPIVSPYNANVTDSVILYNYQLSLEENENLNAPFSFTVNLYDPTQAVSVGSTITIKNIMTTSIGNNQIVINTPSGTIDNITNKTYICSDRGSITLVTDKINWYTISSSTVIGKLTFSQDSFSQTIINKPYNFIYYTNTGNNAGTFTTNSGYFTITNNNPNNPEPDPPNPPNGTIIKNITNYPLRLRVNAVTMTYHTVFCNITQSIRVFVTNSITNGSFNYGYTSVPVNINYGYIQSNGEFDLPAGYSMGISLRQDGASDITTNYNAGSFPFTQLTVTHISM